MIEGVETAIDASFVIAVEDVVVYDRMGAT